MRSAAFSECVFKCVPIGKSPAQQFTAVIHTVTPLQSQIDLACGQAYHRCSQVQVLCTGGKSGHGQMGFNTAADNKAQKCCLKEVFRLVYLPLLFEERQEIHVFPSLHVFLFINTHLLLLSLTDLN